MSVPFISYQKYNKFPNRQAYMLHRIALSGVYVDKSLYLLYKMIIKLQGIMFSHSDLLQLKEKGIAPERARLQLASFVSGFPPLGLDRPATVGDGIKQLGVDETEELLASYEEAVAGRRIVKFVPASGAASRMFKDVYAWRRQLEEGTDTDALLDGDAAAAAFFGRMKEFAFWDDLLVALDKDCLDGNHLLAERNFLPVIDYLLHHPGLDYADTPKGLIAFHRYGQQQRTPVEEHMAEGAMYARNSDAIVRIHFTVSPEHMERFVRLVELVKGKYEQMYGMGFDITFSVQKPSTDTIAADLNNEPFREADGSLLFRPGGHGALIENLNELDADLVFIKNIDNVVPEQLLGPTLTYKKALGAMLLRLQKQAHHYLRLMEGEQVSETIYYEARQFAIERLNTDSKLIPESAPAGVGRLKELLDRPMRVCGMVKNVGEPGGGPFWAKDPASGHLSLQIVESSQLDAEDPRQMALFRSATHFNPVDLVCAIKDYRGRRFDLKAFVDERTGFISHKSKDGKALKALELPGLWNGAMADWITLFVEVPLITFNPVKTVNDLLRDEHQGEP
jgi:hypothetical protein